MKLFVVWNAGRPFGKDGDSPWNILTAMKKPPKVAYRILKYGAKLGAEFEIIEKHRIKLVYEAAGVPEGGQVDIKPNSPEFMQFGKRFSEFLDGESDLEPIGMSMDELIDALGSEKENAISENNLALLEPFFTEKPKPELKAVKDVA